MKADPNQEFYQDEANVLLGLGIGFWFSILSAIVKIEAGNVQIVQELK